MQVSVLGELVRMVLGLGLVAACIWALGRLARRRSARGGRFGMARSAPIQVVARQPLAKGVALVAVRIGEQVLVLGVGSSRVTKIAEVEAEALVAQAGTGGAEPVMASLPGGRAWRAVVAGYRPGSQWTAFPARDGGPVTAWTSSRLERLRELTIRRG
ncbi:MAG: FliO/MopB family protein [Acidimicrobiales bacterium]